MTKTKETKTKIAVIGAIVASAILTGIFITYPAISSVYAQSFNTTTTAGTGSQIPKITGSINVVQTTKNVIKDNLKVSLSQAADIAEKQITNGTIVGGHLGEVQE